MNPDYLSRDNVLVVSFGDNLVKDTNAYQALTDLEQLDSQGQIKIADAAVVTRDQDGHIEVKSEVGNDPYLGTASGGVIGLLLGILGGPLGVLLGGTYGALVGSLFDIDDAETTDSVLGEISKQARPTRTVVLAQVDEQSPEVIDAASSRSSRRSRQPRRRSARPSARPARSCSRRGSRRATRMPTPRWRS